MMRNLPLTLVLIISSLLVHSNIAASQPLQSANNVERGGSGGSSTQQKQQHETKQLAFLLDEPSLQDEMGANLNLTSSTNRKHAMGNVFLIRHGEKEKREKPGLSDRGVARAECLKTVFGKGRKREVDFIMAQDFRPDGRRKRPYETVLPLAKQLNKKVHRKCDRDDPKCAAEVVNYHASRSENVLLAWEHKRLSQVASHLGIKHLKYPSKRYDIIFRLRANKHGKWKVRSITSEECKNLDKKFVGWHAKKRHGKFVDWRSWETRKETEEAPQDDAVGEPQDAEDGQDLKASFDYFDEDDDDQDDEDDDAEDGESEDEEDD